MSSRTERPIMTRTTSVQVSQVSKQFSLYVMDHFRVHCSFYPELFETPSIHRLSVKSDLYLSQICAFSVKCHQLGITVPHISCLSHNLHTGKASMNGHAMKQNTGQGGSASETNGHAKVRNRIQINLLTEVPQMVCKT